MLKTYIELPGGRVLSSGDGENDAIISLSYTQSVNSGQELKLGSVCAGVLEVKLWGGAEISAGDRLKVWRQKGEVRHPLGIFFAEKPTRSGAHILKLTAYDPVVLLDRDVTELLKELPSTNLQVLAETVCDDCGVELTGEELPLGQLTVAGISGEGITGRQVLSWIGELTGRFCRANPEGQLEFSWYRENPNITIGATANQSISWEDGVLTGLIGNFAQGVLTLSGEGSYQEGTLHLEIAGEENTLGYYSGSFSHEEYTVAPTQKVQLRKTADDVGTVFPDGLEGAVNTYILEGNPLLGALEEAALPQVAEYLYTQLQGVSYTPCKISIPATFFVSAGDVVQITDLGGRVYQSYVMTKTQGGQKDTLECTGSHLRSATTAVNNRSYADIRGKVMNLRTDLEGLMAEHHNTADKAARLELDMEGIRSQVSGQEALEEKITGVEQTAENVKISVERLFSDGTQKLKTSMGYTFDDEGLHIQKDQGEMGSRLDESGLQVARNPGTDYETVMLRADAKGVLATDVQVGNYLIIGSFARLEDYPDGRTACFYLGGS